MIMVILFHVIAVEKETNIISEEGKDHKTELPTFLTHEHVHREIRYILRSSPVSLFKKESKLSFVLDFYTVQYSVYVNFYLSSLLEWKTELILNYRILTRFLELQLVRLTMSQF